jgi:DNA-binding NarL/FixJ family response regulator
VTVADKTRIVVADDHAIVRKGVRLILEGEPDLEVVGEAGDGAAAVRVARETCPHVVVLDVSMPRLTGLQAARQLAEAVPDTRVLMLSVHDDEDYFFEALRAGACGYVLKSALDRDLIDGCRAVMRGEPFFHAGAINALIRAYLTHVRQCEGRSGGSLTDREAEVVKLVAEGHTSRKIAALLTISERTVERHRENILEKLGMRDRVELTRYAIRRGLIEP